MGLDLNRIMVGDCVKGMRGLPEESVDLAFADPPFNIGYEYDRYDDRRPHDEYLRWSKDWMNEVKRILAPTGSFWLAIGDEYAAELKVLATQELGFTCRNWVIWYYTFGVHCQSKFTRSHAHMFYFVKNKTNHTFNDDLIRVPSARQLVYADKRANPKGRVPDDTWIIRPNPDPSWVLRPQDLDEGFSADSDTWCFPRVCGTFRERMGFHGCQMPEQLLGRIIQSCSNKGDVVFDPFVGSGTTLAVAKKLGRRYLGCELSRNYVTDARRRIDKASVGAPLEGSELSAGKKSPDVNTQSNRGPRQTQRRRTQPTKIHGLSKADRAIVSCYESTRKEYSADRLIADPELNEKFLSSIRAAGVQGEPVDWNMRLLRLRKASRLKNLGATRHTRLDNSRLVACELAAEIALRQMMDSHHQSLDTVLCCPKLVQEFDELASEIFPEEEDVLYYRWAAFRLRKTSRERWKAAQTYFPKLPEPPRRSYDLKRFRKVKIDPSTGLFFLRTNQIAFVGDTPDLAAWRLDLERYNLSTLLNDQELTVGILPLETPVFSKDNARRGAKAAMVAKVNPAWNLLRQPAA